MNKDPSPVIWAKLTPQLKARLTGAARKNSQSISAYVRENLARWLDYDEENERRITKAPR